MSVTLRISGYLKNRFSGETGMATSVRYDQDTGRMSEVIDAEEIL